MADNNKNNSSNNNDNGHEDSRYLNTTADRPNGDHFQTKMAARSIKQTHVTHGENVVIIQKARNRESTSQPTNQPARPTTHNREIGRLGWDDDDRDHLRSSAVVNNRESQIISRNNNMK